MKKLLLLVSISASLLFVTLANAAVITHGTLTTDDTTNYITDTLTGRQYTRLDQTGLTYSQLQVEMASGGSWEGWSIATSVESDDFINALLGGGSTCSGAVSYGTTCGLVSGWTDGDLGGNYDTAIDYWSYISTQQTPGRPESAIGTALIQASGTVRDYDDWGTIGLADYFAGNAGARINYLLYAPAPVPLPAAVWLFGSALAGLGFVTRKRKKAA